MILAALAVYGFWIEPSSIALKHYDVPVADARLKGLKIAVISDLHGGAPYIDIAKIDRIVAMTNAAKPDLILLGGDYAGHLHVVGHPLPMSVIATHLKPLSAPLGVYAVLGNHDHKVEGAARVRAALLHNDIMVLVNSHALIRGGAFYLAGIDDADSAHANPAQTLAGIPPGRATLCFTHSPDIFPWLDRTCALTIAGHTHGGQVWLPLLGRVIVPSHYGQRYAAGLIQEDGKTYFVSTGIGTSIIPLRLGVPPEISFLTLR